MRLVRELGAVNHGTQRFIIDTPELFDHSKLFFILTKIKVR
jgi:hypothetical protein